MATAVDTVSVSREALLDAIGWLFGAANVFDALNGNVDSCPGELFSNATTDLLKAAFGPTPESDEEYETDPTVVEMWARGYEHAATVLRKLSTTRELVKPLDVEDLAYQWGRCDKWAADVRAAGNVRGERR